MYNRLIFFTNVAFIQNGVLEDDDLMEIGIVDFNHRRYGRKKLDNVLFKIV